MKLKICIALSLLAFVNVAKAFECNMGLSKWFLPFGHTYQDKTIWPNDQKMQICQPFNAFGVRYVDGFRIKVRGGNGAGALQVYPRSGYNSPGAFDLRISQGKYKASSLGTVHMRVTETELDLDRIARIINEGFPCIKNGPFRPVVAFVATFTCMLQKNRNVRDTFQAILAINGQKIYVVLNYHQLHDAGGLQFALVDRKTKNKFFFADVDRKNIPAELVSHTNGARKGVWVYDISEAEPKRPDHCNKEVDQCTMTNFGSIHTFSDAFTVAPYEDLTVLSQYIKDPSYDCNFIARVRMEVHHEVKYVEISVGHFDPEVDLEKSMTHFDFDRITGTARRRGGGRYGAETLNIKEAKPYIWQQGNNKIRIRVNSLGWTLHSEFCDYRIDFRPNGHEPEFVLYRGEDYKGLLTGLCSTDRNEIYS